MSILKYFKRSSDLPKPEGPLGKELDPYTIRLVNENVKSEIEKSRSGKQGPYNVNYNYVNNVGVFTCMHYSPNFKSPNRFFWVIHQIFATPTFLAIQYPKSFFLNSPLFLLQCS